MPSADAALQVPALQGRGNDYAGMLQPTTRQQLEQVLKTFEEQESTQIAVLTITTLGGDSLEEFSLRVAETWGLGQKDRDNGALLLIVRNDRKLRIEVGYGLEGTLTDLIAGRIIRDVITTQFRKGNFDQGVINGVNAMIAAVRGEFTNDHRTTTVTQPPSDDYGGIIAVAFWALFFIGKLFRRHGIIAAIAGGILLPAVAWFAHWSWLLVIGLLPIGMFLGFLASKLLASGVLATSFRSGGGSSWGSGGGFSGGGGGFGGGGSSGGW